MSDWRSDPAWRLVYFDADVYTGGGPATPTADAELAQHDSWASAYQDNRLVATWERHDITHQERL